MEQRDQTAFETLIRRHTPGIRAVCRRWLRCLADIDDATQATFLVLVQRASVIRDRNALGPWLYRVAMHTARRLHKRKRLAPLLEDVPGDGQPVYDDLGEILAAAVARLPEKYRLPVQLCYLSGLTTEQTARCLGCPKGTVLTRLAWARKRLQRCLEAQGVAPTFLPALACLHFPPVSPSWVTNTVETAENLLTGHSAVPSGVSLQTISLAKGVVQEMMWNRWK